MLASYKYGPIRLRQTVQKQADIREIYGSTGLFAFGRFALRAIAMTRWTPSTEQFETLTKAERDCLHRVLDHQTAKEIALDLDITHHAVEKRLRRSREKLGAQSSIEAARWSANHYGWTGYGSSDLEPTEKENEISSRPPSEVERQRRFAAMIITSLVLSLMLAGSNPPEPQSTADVATALENTLEQELHIAAANFERLDLDNSGFIEKSEFVSPFSEYFLGMPSKENISDEKIAFEADEIHIRYLDEAEEKAVIRLKDGRIAERRAVMFALMDRDKDDRLDASEFRLAHLEGIGPKTFTIHLDQNDG